MPVSEVDSIACHCGYRGIAISASAASHEAGIITAQRRDLYRSRVMSEYDFIKLRCFLRMSIYWRKLCEVDGAGALLASRSHYLKPQSCR